MYRHRLSDYADYARPGVLSFLDWITFFVKTLGSCACTLIKARHERMCITRTPFYPFLRFYSTAPLYDSLEQKHLINLLSHSSWHSPAQALQHPLHGPHHPWRPTKQRPILCSRRRKMLLHHLPIHKPAISCPLGIRLAEHIVQLKFIRAFLRKGIKFRAQQDVVFGVVCIQQRDARGVLRVLANSPDELVHWHYTRAAGDHGDVLCILAGVLHCALGPADVDWLSDGHVFEVACHRAVRVNFDEKRNAAKVIVIGNWGVGPGDGLAVDGCAQGDVLACWEAKDIVGVRERKDQAVDMWCDFLLASEGEGTPLAGVEDSCSFTGDVCVRYWDKVCCLGETVRLVVGEFLLHVKFARCPYA